MSHLIRGRAERAAVIAAKRCAIQPEPPDSRDFADTEQMDEEPQLAGWDWLMPEPQQPKEQQS